jgi:hypothetical protein
MDRAPLPKPNRPDGRRNPDPSCGSRALLADERSAIGLDQLLDKAVARALEPIPGGSRPRNSQRVLVMVPLLWTAILGARLIRLSRVRPAEPAI